MEMFFFCVLLTDNNTLESYILIQSSKIPKNQMGKSKISVLMG